MPQMDKKEMWWWCSPSQVCRLRGKTCKILSQTNIAVMSAKYRQEGVDNLKGSGDNIIKAMIKSEEGW